MKLKYVAASLVIASVVPTYSFAGLLARFCATSFSRSAPAPLAPVAVPLAPPKVGFDKVSEWRQDQTNLSRSGEVVPTSKGREQDIKDSIDLMVEEAEDDGVAATMFPIIADGVKSKFEDSPGYETGILPKVTVSGGTGVVKATLLLSASGHVGKDDAECLANLHRYAKIDTYTIRWKSKATGKTKDLVVNAPSRGIVTAQEVEIELEETGVQIYYERSGSAGSGGYLEGRIIDLDWHK